MPYSYIPTVADWRHERRTERLILVSRKDEIQVRKLAQRVGGIVSLAKILGVHRSTFYRYLTGFYPIPPEFAVRINLLSATLGVDAPLNVDIESAQHEWLDRSTAEISAATKKKEKKA